MACAGRVNRQNCRRKCGKAETRQDRQPVDPLWRRRPRDLPRPVDRIRKRVVAQWWGSKTARHRQDLRRDPLHHMMIVRGLDRKSRVVFFDSEGDDFQTGDETEVPEIDGKHGEAKRERCGSD